MKANTLFRIVSFAVLAAMIFSLCACAAPAVEQNKPVPESGSSQNAAAESAEPEYTEPERTEAESVASKPSAGGSNASSNRPGRVENAVLNAPLKIKVAEADQDDRLMKKLEEELSKMDRRDVVGADAIQSLQTLGYRVSVENVSLPDADRLLFDLVLRAEEEEKVFSGLEADLNYTVGDWQTAGNSLSLYWGCVTVLDGKIYVADRTGVQVWDPAAQMTDRLMMETFTGQKSPVYVFDMHRYANDWYAVSCYRRGKGAMLCLLDEKAQLKKEVLLEEAYYSEGWKLSTSISAWRFDHCSDNMQEIWFDEWYVCLPLEGLFCTATELLRREEGDLSFALYRLEGNSERRYLAAVCRGEEELYRQIQPMKLGNGAFCPTEMQKGITKASVFLAKDGKTAEVFCPYSELRVTFRFDEKSVWERYGITEAQIEGKEPFATSADGCYALYEGATFGGGDYWVCSILLKDLQTGRLAYVGENSGMYGGGEECGFFANGDIYLFGHTEFIIYEKGMPPIAPKLMLGDRFPLGTVEEGDIRTRLLFAVRRDPQAFTYIVMYADCPVDTFSAQTERFLWKLEAGDKAVTYKIGLLNEKGVLQQSFDTGVSVTSTPFGYNTVDMYLKDGNQLCFAVSGGKQGAVYGEGVFDLTTFTTSFAWKEH